MIERMQRPLHHLRLRPRRPARRRGVPRAPASRSSCSTSTPRRSRSRASGTCPFIEGSGTEDEDLEAAGLERARGLVAVVRLGRRTTSTSRSPRAPRGPTCRSSRAPRPRTPRTKLRRAGADRVVQPYATAGQEMAKLMLKPQVAAFLDIVSPHGGPDLRFEEIEVTTDVPAGGPDDPRAPDPPRDRRADRRAAQGGRHASTRRPIPDATLDAGDVLIAVGTRAGAAARSRSCSRRTRGRCRLERRRSALAARARRGRRRARSSSSGPSDPAHGDYATNVALRLAPAQAARRRASSPRSSPRPRPALPEVERAEVAGPGLRQPLPRATRWFGEALGEILEAGDGVRRRLGRAARARPGRDGLREPDRPDHRRRRRGTARTATRVARLLEFAGHEVEREYYYNDVGRADGRASAPRSRRSGAGRSRPRTATSGDVRRRARRASRATRCRRCSSGSRRRSSGSASTSTPGRCRASSSSGCPSCSPRLDTYETDGALWARSSAYGDDEDRVLLRSETAAADLPRRRRRLPRRQARARLRPRDLRARRRPPRHAQLVRGGRADARLRPGAGRGAALPARPPDEGRRAGEDVEAPRRRRLPRRVHGRDRRRRRALVPRQPRPRPDDRDRRRPRRRAVARRTRSTTSSTRTPGSPGSCATPATPRSRAEPRRRARAGGARARQAARGVPGGRRARRPSGAARTRSRPTRSASPTTSTASTTTTACSRASSRRSGSASAVRRRR